MQIWTVVSSYNGCVVAAYDVEYRAASAVTTLNAEAGDDLYKVSGPVRLNADYVDFAIDDMREYNAQMELRYNVQ
jgi:aminoglycoside phosphotransferase family enzyme